MAKGSWHRRKMRETFQFKMKKEEEVTQIMFSIRALVVTQRVSITLKLKFKFPDPQRTTREAKL